MKSCYSKKMKMDILRGCGFGRRAAKNLIGSTGATDEVIQKAAVIALTNMENEKAAIEGEKRYRDWRINQRPVR